MNLLNISAKKPALLVFIYFLFCNAVIKAQISATNTGTMYISAGTIFDAEGAFTTSATGNTQNVGDFYVKGNWTNNNTYTSTGKVTFTGTNAQTIGGTATTSFYNVDINKASNGVALLGSTTVSNVLNLINGSLTLGSNTLTISNAATTAIAYTNGFIVSEKTDNSAKVQWNMGSTTGAHIIPFATSASVVIPLTLNLTAGTIGNVTASTYVTAANNTPYPTSPINVTQVHNALGIDNSANMVDRFWEIDKTGVSGTLTTTFTYAAAEAPSSGAIGLVSQRYNSSNNGWIAPLPGQTFNAFTNTVTTPGITTFGPFALTQGANPLPIELLMFNAQSNKAKQVMVNWATASEQNNAYFTVEHSKDDVNFEFVENIKAAGNSSNVLSYETLDKNPYQGISYYRLKQTDFNGEFKYSESKRVNLTEEQTSALSIFPSPATTSAYFNIKNVLGKLKVDLYDTQGQLISAKEYDGTQNLITVERENIAAGVYFIKAMDENGTPYSGKIMFQ